MRYSRPLVAINIREGDELIEIFLTDGQQDLIFATHLGYVLWYPESEVGIVGPRAAGVKAISLKEGDFVVGADHTSTDRSPSEQAICVVTQRGAIKKMRLAEFERATRAKRGLITLRELKNNPHRLIGMKIVDDPDELIIRTENGKEEIISVSTLRYNDRYSNGSFVIDEKTDGKANLLYKKTSSKDD